MPQIVLYIAQSLDGFIAKPDGGLEWLTSIPNPKSGGDYGYAELMSSIGTIIMGRKTYAFLLAMSQEWYYPNYKTFVLSNDKDFVVSTPNTFAFSGDLTTWAQELKQNTDKDIWLVGGGQVISSFINAQLLDKMIITIVPKIIGEGIPLFAPKPAESDWKLVAVQSFDTGLVNLTYKKISATSTEI